MSALRICVIVVGVLAALMLLSAPGAADNASADPCRFPMTPECDSWDTYKGFNYTEVNTSTEPNTLERRRFGSPCASPVTPDCHNWEEKKNSSEYVLNTSTDPNTLEWDFSSGGFCSVDGFADNFQMFIDTIYVGFFPIAVSGLLGDRLASSLPFLTRSRRRELMEWRGKVLGAGAGMYILLPAAEVLADGAGFPTLECITLVPF